MSDTDALDAIRNFTKSVENVQEGVSVEEGADGKELSPGEAKKELQGKKIAAKQKAKRIAANPLVAAGLVVGVMLLGAAGILLLKGLATNTQLVQAKAVQDNKSSMLDYKALYEKEKQDRQAAEATKEDLLRAQVAKDPALRAIDGRANIAMVAPKGVIKSSSSIPAPLPPVPPQVPQQRIVPTRRTIAYASQQLPPLPIAVAARQSPSSSASNGLGMLGKIVNTDDADTPVKQKPQPTAVVGGVPQMTTGISNSRRIGATRTLEAVLISRVQYVGGGRGTSVPVIAKLTKAVKVGGQVVLPEGTMLLGKLTQTQNNGFVEIFFDKGRLPGDGEEGTFNLAGVATDVDGGVLVANAPRRPDPGGADALSIASEFLKGATSAGLTTYQQGSNSFGGLTSSTTTTNNTDPVKEGIRQATTKSTSILDRSATEARAVSRSGSLDFFLSPGKEMLIVLTQDLVVPPLPGGSEP